jgi:hypothetical protein
MKEGTFGTGHVIIRLKKLDSAAWALKINCAPVIPLQGMEGDFPVALNEFFAHVAVALTTLGAARHPNPKNFMNRKIDT